jgi:uncharacterized RDD family membrane protein YckC
MKLSYTYAPSYIPEKKYRIFALLIDFAILGIIFIPISLFVDPRGDQSPLKISLYLLTWIILFPVCEGIKGFTIGKKIMKLKVVQLDFTQVSLSNAIIRHLFDIIDFQLFGLIGLMIAANNKYNRRLGDLIGMTIVVKADEELPE